MMPALSQFDTPANISDLDPTTLEGQKLRRTWSENINRWTNLAILGDPWSSQFDENRSFYFNPLNTSIPSSPDIARIAWTAFPGRIIEFYDGKFPRELLYAWADFGGAPGMPRDVCHPGDSTPVAFTPLGPRGWQDEYCEWSVRRSGDNIVSIMFTCENPEYWHTLWRASPDRVLELYRQLVNPAIQMDDLVLKDAGGVVADPSTGQPAYNPLNRWNFGTVTLPDRGGAVHLTSSPNTLGAEIYLAAAATILRKDENGAQIVTADGLICCTRYGRPKRNSDPLIGFNVNTIVSGASLPQVTLANPVGLYIQEPDWTNWELPPGAPSDASPRQFWHIVRGDDTKDAEGFSMGLHAVFEVPPALGFTVSDIKINGENIRFGSQIARTFKIGLKAIATPSGQPNHPMLSCPEDRIPALPYASLLQNQKLYAAYRAVELRANELPLSIPISCYEVQQNSMDEAYMLAINASPDVSVTVPEGGVQITIKESGETPEGLLCRVQIQVDASAAPGDRTVQLSNADGTHGPAAIGLLTIVPAAGPPPLPLSPALLNVVTNERRPGRRAVR